MSAVRPPDTAAPAPHAMAADGRWESLDAVRGMTVAGMLLVNNPGSWDAVYPPLQHAAWHGWTPTDLIFPFFLFIVGITTELSLRKRAARGADDGAIRRRILIRGGLIVLLGLLLAAFPFFPLERITGLRFPGVLQRIGVCYSIAALIGWHRSTRAVALWSAALLLGYWAILTLIPAPGEPVATIDVPDRTIAAWLDRVLLDGHLWAATRTWDPEGPLSTLPAIGTTLLGILTGRWLEQPLDRSARLNGLFAAGVIGVAIGSAWGWIFPINKNLWTSSYVLFTAGAAALLLGTVSWTMEIRGVRSWARPFVTFGTNPLIAFLGSGMMARLIGSLIRVEYGGATVPLREAIYRSIFASWLPPRPASLAFAAVFVLTWYLLLVPLERRGWLLRV